jgi:hypothetical protein
MEKGRWRRVGGEGQVEKGGWRRAGGEAYSYSPVLHCCHFALTADWLLAVCITAKYVIITFEPHIVTYIHNKNQQNAKFLHKYFTVIIVSSTCFEHPIVHPQALSSTSSHRPHCLYGCIKEIS